MRFDWSTFLCALGLAFVLEGLPYFLWAERMPKYLRHLSSQPPRSLRILGLTSMLLGLLVVLWARS